MQPNEQQPSSDETNTTPIPPSPVEATPTVNGAAENSLVQSPAEPTPPSAQPESITPAVPFTPTVSGPVTGLSPTLGNDTANTNPAVTPVTPANPTKPSRIRLSKKGKLIALIVAVVVLLVGGTAGAYFGIIVPNKPENIWKSAMNNSGKAYDALSEYAVKQRDSKGSQVEGSYSLKGAIVSDGKFSSKSLGSDSQSTGTVSAAGMQVGFDVRTLKSTGETPDLYFKLTGLQGLGSLIGGGSEFESTLNGVNDQWFVVDHTLFEQFGTSANTQYTRQDAANLLKTVGAPTKEYLFSADNQKAVFVVKQMVGSEKKEGRNTYHYKVAYDSTNLGKYVSALCDNLKKDKIGKELFAREAVDCSQLAKEASANKSTGTADVWVDKRTKLVHIVRFSDKDNYVELGQDYQGGKNYPFSVVFNSKESGATTEGSIKGNLDTKTDIVKIDGSLNSKPGSGGKETTGTLSLTISPTKDTSLKVEKPANAKSLIELINSLGLGGLLGGGGSTQGGMQAKARDQQRTTDINNLHAKLEEFYNNEGYYPRTFTAATFEGIDEGSLKDPVGDDFVNIVPPVANAAAADAYPAPTSDTKGSPSYLYVPYPTGCTNNCTGYRLKSFIEQPTSTTPNPYVKKSLD